MNRRDLLALPAFLTLVTLDPRTGRAADRIRVGMLKPNIVTVIYWIAVKTGAFDKNGLDIAENPFPSGQTAAGIEQLLRGGIPAVRQAIRSSPFTFISRTATTGMLRRSDCQCAPSSKLTNTPPSVPA